MDFKKTIQLIDSATADFEKSVSSSERLIYAETQKIIKSLEIDASGNIKPSVKNLRLLTKMRKYVARLANNKGYLKAVKDLVNSFEDVYQSQMKYFATITQNVPHTKKYALMKQIAADNVTTNLTGAGVQASVTDKINDILLRAVTSGAKYADLTKELHEHLTATDKGSGALSKYANTYATTAISQYAGENNKILTDDLGLEWFEYVGSNIETTREFCEHLTKKRYVHKSEIKTILKGDIDGHQCEIYEKTGLPKGMIEGTNEQNFQVNCGGWNCRHQLVPVAKEAVPLDIRAKFEKNESSAPKQAEKPTKTEDETKNVELEKALGVKKGTPMSFEQANELRGNPHFVRGSFSGYTINCQTCVVANELRRRGFDVEAMMNTKHKDNLAYKLSLKTENAWINPTVEKITMPFNDGSNWKVIQAIERFYRDKSGGESSKFLPVNSPDESIFVPNGRYHLRYKWKGNNGGHIITFEKIDVGNYRFYDPQNGKLFEFSNSFMIDYSKPIEFYRVDNLKFNLEYANVVAKANSTKASKVKYAKKQNGWNEAIGEGEAPDVIKPDNANFTFNSKGFVKTNKNRLIRANTNKNERMKFEKELRMAKTFAKQGSKVELLEEKSGLSSCDAIIDGKKVDFKSLSSSNNIIRHAKKAIRGQGADFVYFEFTKKSYEIIVKINQLKNIGIHGKYYFKGEDIVYDF